MSQALLNTLSQNMDKSIQSLRSDLSKLRTGRASTALVDGVQVEYYGSNVPISQVANITTPDARTIQIAPWEGNMIGAIEKSILAANIGLTPQNDGKVIRISLPQITEERRKELAKQVKKMGKDTKVAIRNVRHDANDDVKKQEKDKVLTQDDSKKLMEQIQKKTNEKTAEVDKVVAAKEKEIMTV